MRRTSHKSLFAGIITRMLMLLSAFLLLLSYASMVVNPFDRMKLGSAVRESTLRREAPSYLTACGLAMRRFVQ